MKCLTTSLVSQSVYKRGVQEQDLELDMWVFTCDGNYTDQGYETSCARGS
jgi:hypothetical protein